MYFFYIPIAIYITEIALWVNLILTLSKVPNPE